ncbi:MAG: hypothetical protein FWH18_04180 [Marinilabiliaceae bacterium]|nr:hypothetical protein [Marinilabiliaceae bacterium]
MNVLVETAVRKTENKGAKKHLYTLEETFDRIDKKFIDFYGEYGRKIVNTRRSEWNQDNVVNLKQM